MAVTANAPILLNPCRPYSPGPFPRLSHKIASRRAIRSSVSSEKTVPGGDRMLVFVPPHPLIKHWISVMRNEQTPPAIFRSAMAELGRILIYEASRDWLPTVAGEVQSPMGVAAVEFIDPRESVTIIPILRAGLALSEHAPLVLPATRTYHLGICRDEVTLQPSTYLNNLPDEFPAGTRIFVVDPMLATGGTIVAALSLLKERGVDNKQIRVICVSELVSPSVFMICPHCLITLCNDVDICRRFPSSASEVEREISRVNSTRIRRCRGPQLWYLKLWSGGSFICLTKADKFSSL